MYTNAQGNVVEGESDIANAVLSDPTGAVCAFCGGQNDNADDCGWWYLFPDPDVKEGRPACCRCHAGEPGRKHIDRYGVGER